MGSSLTKATLTCLSMTSQNDRKCTYKSCLQDTARQKDLKNVIKILYKRGDFGLWLMSDDVSSATVGFKDGEISLA